MIYNFFLALINKMQPQNHIRMMIIPRKFQYKGFELFIYFHFSPKLQFFKISCRQAMNHF